MTLEASLLMPMVICVMALIIYFSFYLYGRCVISQDAYILAFRASLAWDDDTSPAEYVEEHSGAIAGKKYFGSSFPEFETAISGKEIMVEGGSEAKHSAMGRYFLKPSEGWDFARGGQAKKRRYAEHIRSLTRLRDIGKEITDMGVR